MIGWLPPTYSSASHSSNASNGPFRIVIKEDVTAPAAILGQERNEWNWGAIRTWSLVAAMLGLGIFLQLHWMAVLMMSVAGLAVGGTFLKFMPKLAQRREALAHEVEVQIAVEWYGMNEESYRAGEVNSILRYWHSKGRTHDEVKAQMLSYKAEAKSWIEKHRKRIDKDFAYFAK